MNLKSSNSKAKSKLLSILSVCGILFATYSCSDGLSGVSADQETSFVNENPYTYIGDLHTLAMEQFQANHLSEALASHEFRQKVVTDFTVRFLDHDSEFFNGDQNQMRECVNFTLSHMNNAEINKSSSTDTELADLTAAVDSVVSIYQLDDSHYNELVKLCEILVQSSDLVAYCDSLDAFDQKVLSEFGEEEAALELIASAIAKASLIYWSTNLEDWFSTIFPDSTLGDMDAFDWGSVGRADARGGFVGMVAGAVGGAVVGGGAGAGPGAVGGAAAGAVAGSLGDAIDQFFD